jgi:hypothetical protein
LSDSKIFVIPAELAQKIDDNRGDMSRAEFIDALITDLVADKSETKSSSAGGDYATKADLITFEQDMKQLLKSFLDFFMAYDLELGDNNQQGELEKFTSKLQGLQKDLGTSENGNSKGGGGKATIKWKA